jgi:ATP-dependent protease ClpP protease subunit
LEPRSKGNVTRNPAAASDYLCINHGDSESGYGAAQFHSFAVAVNNGVKTVHFLFQSSGGLVGDGIALHNYFRNLPIELHAYNTGSVSSIGVIVFLGAHNRYASANATFVIHKTHMNPGSPANAERARGMADSMKIDDARTLAIFRDNLSLSNRRLERYRTSELPFDAQAALDCGMIKEVRDFQVPAGHPLSNI